MTEPDEQEELEEPSVTDVPEPDQDEHDEALEEDSERLATEAELPQDDAGIERAFKSLAKEATRHANRISEIMGDDANLLQPCPRCITTDPQRPATPGFIWPHEMVPLLPEDKAKVKLSIGEGGEAEFKPNDDAYGCPKCAGHGKYPTGSFVAAQKFIQCDQCDGRGWIGQRAISAPAVNTNDVPAFVTVGAADDEPRPESDPWGRLKDDPLYGVMPGFER